MTVNDADYAAGNGVQTLSGLGTIIPLEQGQESDEFFLTFETLGSATNVVVEADPAPLPPPADSPRDPVLGVRDFAEVNATMAKVTGIPTSNSAVAETYSLVRQAMPVDPALAGFVSSQQMGITQLAIRYCSELVDNNPGYFAGFNFGASVDSAFADRSLVIDPLIANMVGANLPTQPDPTTVSTELNALITRLAVCNAPGCSDPVEQTSNVVKATCAAVLGSAATMMQ